MDLRDEPELSEIDRKQERCYKDGSRPGSTCVKGLGQEQHHMSRNSKSVQHPYLRVSESGPLTMKKSEVEMSRTPNNST